MSNINFKLWQNSQTLNWTKLKNSNCDKTKTPQSVAASECQLIVNFASSVLDLFYEQTGGSPDIPTEEAQTVGVAFNTCDYVV